MLAEIDDLFTLLVVNQGAAEIHISLGHKARKRLDVVLESVVTVQLGLQDFIGGDGIGLGRMGVVEVLAAAVEAVSRLEVAGLHRVEDVLHIHQQGRVQVHIDLLAGQLHPLELLAEHREVELDGIEAGQVAVLKPLCYLLSHIVKGGAVRQHIVSDAVHLARLRADGPLASIDIIPRLYLPSLYATLAAREDFHETQFYYRVRRNIEPRTFDVEKKQGSFEIQFHLA